MQNLLSYSNGPHRMTYQHPARSFTTNQTPEKPDDVMDFDTRKGSALSSQMRKRSYKLEN